MFKKILFQIFTLLLCVNTLSAQDEKEFGVATYAGFDAGLIEYTDKKIQIGINPYYDLSKHFAIESQLSVTFFEGSSLSGSNSLSTYTHILIGVRYYILKPAIKWRPHINLLYGYLGGIDSDMVLSGFTGLSTGIYVSKKKGLYFGIAFETEESVVFKIGYRF